MLLERYVRCCTKDNVTYINDANKLSLSGTWEYTPGEIVHGEESYFGYLDNENNHGGRVIQRLARVLVPLSYLFCHDAVKAWHSVLSWRVR